MSDLFPPSIKREAEDPEMQTWAYEATSALEAGRVAGQTCLERYREAGAVLSKARVKCSHGKWRAWLKANGISKSSAARAIQAFKCPRVGTFEDDVGAIADAGEEPEKEFEAVEGVKYCSRECRLGTGKKGCKKCAKLNKVKKERGPKVPEPPYDGPERLAPVFEEVSLYNKAARSARNLRINLQKIERGISYPASTRGFKTKEHLSDKAINIQRAVEQRPPSKPCPDCDLTPSSGETAWCDTCKGKGYLRVSDVEVADGAQKADEK